VVADVLRELSLDEKRQPLLGMSHKASVREALERLGRVLARGGDFETMKITLGRSLTSWGARAPATGRA